MPLVQKSALVAHSAAQMYALVNDIESYPDFLPWCRAAKILSSDEDEIRATIEISRGGLNKSFTTSNRLQPGKMIEIRLLDGPFQHLQGFWRFSALPESGCKVALDLEFEFSGMLMRMTVGPVFNQIADSLVDAFCLRAKQIYD